MPLCLDFSGLARVMPLKTGKPGRQRYLGETYRSPLLIWLSELWNFKSQGLREVGCKTTGRVHAHKYFDRVRYIVLLSTCGSWHFLLGSAQITLCKVSCSGKGVQYFALLEALVEVGNHVMVIGGGNTPLVSERELSTPTFEALLLAQQQNNDASKMRNPLIRLECGMDYNPNEVYAII
jgi:hypothetical protein